MKRKLLALLVTASLLCGCAKSEEIPTVDVGKIMEETPSKITIGDISENNISQNGGSDSMGENSAAEIPPSVTDNSNTPNSSGESSSAQTPSSSSGTQSSAAANSQKRPDGVVINADVTVPQATSYGVYYSYTESCSEAKALEIKQILPVDQKAKYTVTNSRNGNNYHWRTDDSEIPKLVINGYSSDITFDSELAWYIRYWVFDPPNPGKVTNIKFFEQRDLDFCTREKAVKTVTDILDKLEISVCPNPEIYSLDVKGLEKATAAIIEELPAREEDMKKADKSLECYYIRFNAEFGGIPIYNKMINYDTFDGFMNNPEITAIVSANGLEYLYISRYPRKNELKNSVTTLIPAQSAAQKVVDKYGDIANTSVMIDKIELMYINDILDKKEIAERNGAVKLTPAWVCSGTKWETLSKPGFGTWENEKHFEMLIDAVTGKQII